MPIITIGIDLAKNIFLVHGVNENGRTELVKLKISRDQLLPLIANLPPCTIGIEACTAPGKASSKSVPQAITDCAV